MDGIVTLQNGLVQFLFSQVCHLAFTPTSLWSSCCEALLCLG
jgi:hypothetical protein